MKKESHMFKKILTTCAVCVIGSSAAFANGAPYVGGSIGINALTSSYNNFRGAPGTLFVGYGANVDPVVYFGGELFGTVGTITISNNNASTSKGLKTSYGYGASFIPGLMLSEHTMAFARAGLVRTRFSSAGVTAT